MYTMSSFLRAEKRSATMRKYARRTRAAVLCLLVIGVTAYWAIVACRYVREAVFGIPISAEVVRMEMKPVQPIEPHDDKPEWYGHGI